MKSESKETAKDEKKESPAKQKEEQAEGTEGVVLPEEFQKEAHALVQKATSRHHTAHIHRLVNDKEDEIMKAGSAKSHKVPQEYSTAGMPS